MNRLKVLYVEDNDDLREGIGEMLEGENRVVVTCANAEAAMVAFDAQPADVVVTDVSLPGMSGTELARRLLARNPQQWIVLCSGYEFGKAVSSLGPNARALPKPFELDQLDALMDEISMAIGDRAGV